MMSDTTEHLDAVAREAYLEALRLGLDSGSERIAYAVVAVVQADKHIGMEEAIAIARRVAAG